MNESICPVIQYFISEELVEGENPVNKYTKLKINISIPILTKALKGFSPYPIINSEINPVNRDHFVKLRVSDFFL